MLAFTLAYALVWFLVALYLGSLSLRQRNLVERVRDLQRQVDAKADFHNSSRAA